MPCQPIFSITPHLLQLVTAATELRTWIEHSLLDAPWLPILQQETALRLTHSSTAIEGNPLSQQEVSAVIDGRELRASTTANREVLNYHKALRWITKRKINERITESALLHIHKLITNKLLSAEQSGQYKSRPNRVIDAKGHLVYKPPGPEKTKKLTTELLKWTNGETRKSLHPVLVSAIAHHQLVSIHPFTDGNGRVARAFGICLLYILGFDTRHICALDEYFLADRQRYYDKLQQARDLDDDLTFWLEYFAEGVVSTLTQTKKRIQMLQVAHAGRKITLSTRQENVLTLLQSRGRVKAPEIEKEFKITRARVAQIMRPLVDAGYVIREGQTRATTYRLAKSPLSKKA